MRMRVRFGRREVIVVGALVGGVALASLSFGPIVRAVASRDAARRHLELKIGGVRPGWFAVRLLDVQVRPQGVPSIRAHVADLRVGLNALLRVSRLDLSGAEILLTGSPESLREDWHKWRGDRPDATEPRGRSTAVEAVGVSLRWVDPEAPELGAEVRGLALSHDDRGTRLSATDAQLRFGPAGIEVGEAAAETDAAGMLARAHAAALVVGWTGGRAAGGSTGAGAPASSDPPAPLGPTPPVSGRPTRGGHPRPIAPAGDAGVPLVPLPDLHRARAGAARLAALLADRLRQGADVGVDSMTWKVSQDPEKVALTFGPGPLSVTRTSSQLDLRYSTDKRAASTPLALHVVLPTDRGDPVITVEGGPVSLSLLGVKEGAAGLVEVDHATVAGRGRVALAGDGSVLTFDVDAGTRGLSLNQPRLALETVKGLDIALRAAGAITATGEVRLDDFAATLGALRIVGSGTLDQKPDHVTGTARFEIPAATCQLLLDAIPAALLPALQGTKIAGTFAARGRFAFDTRSLDDLELDYKTQDRCRLVQVPGALDHDRFARPFSHRVYLPDGSTTEETTGPGTPNWTPLDQISPYMQTAVLTTEDGAFPKHHGYNHAAIRASIIANLKARRFVRGASTITMQLAKNLFLSRDKTLSRKLEEVVLTDYLEQTFSKDELMELYLNVIEFGPAVYGITSAAEYYFGRAPAELDLAECLFLSSLLPAPLRYSAMREGEQPPDGWMRTLHTLMDVEHKRGLITDAELSEAQNEPILFWHGGPRPAPRSAVRARTPVAGAGADAEIPDPFESLPEAP